MRALEAPPLSSPTLELLPLVCPPVGKKGGADIPVCDCKPCLSPSGPLCEAPLGTPTPGLRSLGVGGSASELMTESIVCPPVPTLLSLMTKSWRWSVPYAFFMDCNAVRLPAAIALNSAEMPSSEASVSQKRKARTDASFHVSFSSGGGGTKWSV